MAIAHLGLLPVCWSIFAQQIEQDEVRPGPWISYSMWPGSCTISYTISACEHVDPSSSGYGIMYLLGLALIKKSRVLSAATGGGMVSCGPVFRAKNFGPIIIDGSHLQKSEMALHILMASADTGTGKSNWQSTTVLRNRTVASSCWRTSP